MNILSKIIILFLFLFQFLLVEKALPFLKKKFKNSVRIISLDFVLKLLSVPVVI
ncbi:hypothetical protein LEP1GSC037_4339 [Leptospira interrogans str. 2006001854]|uniref:Uncharacterized protein n=1 Tax=Leptospira interrogans str. 2006001854 TaxID=1001590 RepID=M6GHV1_LEPIR|nr:hypothetical protein LEP1GSC037_4339 [Leptospira interrogans str. 2006001854]